MKTKPAKIELPPEPKVNKVCCVCGKPVEEVELDLHTEGKQSLIYHVECLLFSLR